MLLDKFLKKIRNRKFPNLDIAAHSLRPNGNFAGSLDDLSGSRLTGWVFDAAQPNHPIKLRLVIDGNAVEEFVTDIYREDIAKLTKGNGINGFEIDLANYQTAQNTSRLIKIELVGKRKYYLGPVNIMIGTNAHQPVGRHQSSLIHGSVGDQLQHIFAHITATYEDNRQRIERLQNTVETLQMSVQGHSAMGLSTSNLAEISHSTIFGIGAFHAAEMDDVVEEKLMVHRIEAQILKHRLRI